jgi:hypothetical protein
MTRLLLGCLVLLLLVGCTSAPEEPISSVADASQMSNSPLPMIEPQPGNRLDSGHAIGQPGTDMGMELPPPCDPSRREDCLDGYDNDCDGMVDENCFCTSPEKPCYPGHPEDLVPANTACRRGTQACRLEFYLPCEGYVLPSPETCDGIDNNCDGIIDNAEGGCTGVESPTAICPPDQFGPPLSNFGLAGVYSHPENRPMASAQWRIIERPAGSTTIPMPQDRLETIVFADLQGVYVLELEVRDDRGGIGRCQTQLTTQSADGLRIEMVWNVNAVGDTSDVDLHLLKTSNSSWFDSGPTGDDCYFANCKVCDHFSEADCREQIAQYNANPDVPPPARVQWSAPLNDDDPRLDLDDVEGQGPENLNIYRPRNGRYRLGVHYWDDDNFGPSTVTVTIFCSQNVTERFGPIVLQPAGAAGTEFWEVADIAWTGDTCQITPLGTQDCPRICTRAEAERNHCAEGQTRGQLCR